MRFDAPPYLLQHLHILRQVTVEEVLLLAIGVGPIGVCAQREGHGRIISQSRVVEKAVGDIQAIAIHAARQPEIQHL